MPSASQPCDSEGQVPKSNKKSPGRTEVDGAEPVAAADGGRDTGFSKFTVAQRGRRC